MDSIFSFYSKLRSEGLTEAQALQQCIHLARTDSNVPFKKAEEVDSDGSSHTKLEHARSLYARGLRGKAFAEEFNRIMTLPENGALQFGPGVKDQQRLYDALVSAGFEDGTPEFTTLFMTAATDLPLTIKQ